MLSTRGILATAGMDLSQNYFSSMHNAFHFPTPTIPVLSQLSVQMCAQFMKTHSHLNTKTPEHPSSQYWFIQAQHLQLFCVLC